MHLYVLICVYVYYKACDLIYIMFYLKLLFLYPSFKEHIHKNNTIIIKLFPKFQGIFFIYLKK